MRDSYEDILRPFAFIREIYLFIFAVTCRTHDTEEETSLDKRCWQSQDTSPLNAHTLPCTREEHVRFREFPNAHLKFGTAIPQISFLFTRLSLPKWRQFKDGPDGWRMDIMMKLQWKPCQVRRLLFSLHSAIQTANSRESVSTRHLLRWYNSQEFPITSVPDISSGLLHDVFPETRILFA